MEPTCLSIDKWTKDPFIINNDQYNGILSKKEKILTYVITWMKFEYIMLREISQSLQDKH
jgi:hypothetical protein